MRAYNGRNNQGVTNEASAIPTDHQRGRREREGAEAVSSISRLLTLDAIWTAYLDHGDRDGIARDLPDSKIS